MESVRKLLAVQIPFEKERFFNRFETLAKQQQHYALLESGRGGRYSIAGLNPLPSYKEKTGQLRSIAGTKKK